MSQKPDEMKKQCSCGALNDLGEMICSSCSSDLIDAEEVYETATGADQGNLLSSEDYVPGDETEFIDEESPCKEKQPVSAVDIAACQADANVCRCNFPCEESVEPGKCQSCGGTISKSSDSGSVTSPSVSAGTNSHGLMMIVLPGGKKFSLTAGLLLGRDTEMVNRCILESLTSYLGVSRRHAWLGMIDGKAFVFDLGSRNGTFIEGKRLAPFVPCPLSHEELPLTVRLGKTLDIGLEKGQAS